ncbi:MAG: hypothetical protein A4S14_12160 [Proteobacteria bacterium SG_bin9]|nr:MAG: hypothetical protein A4S14_12160 [Proteobacteria bacterium SG_bin9]
MLTSGRKTREPRRKQNSKAWIAFPGSFGVVECSVLDMSPSGAKLSVPGAERLGSRFTLTFSISSRQGRMCEVRWRKGSLIGVRFV